jgi:hypothetical protein
MSNAEEKERPPLVSTLRRGDSLLEYLFFKLFDFKGREYYNVKNPAVRILLAKMSYEKGEAEYPAAT